MRRQAQPDTTPDLFAENAAPPQTRQDAVNRAMVDAFNAALTSPDGGDSLRTLPAENEIPEVILNLWYIFDDTGICYALRAKAYVAAGTDEEKLVLLHTLALTDWEISPMYPIPENFRLVGPDGTLTGMFHLGAAESMSDLLPLFEPAIQKMEAEFPSNCKLRILKNPVMCLTPLYLHDDYTMEVRPQDVKRNGCKRILQRESE